MKFLVTEKYYAPDGGATGGDPKEGEPEVVESGGAVDSGEPPVFDPAVPDEQDRLNQLTDEELEALDVKAKPANEPDPAPAQDTAGKDTSKDGASDVPAKLAGKYETPEALVAGLGEATKKLGVPEWANEAAVTLAQKTGDYSVLEGLYKRYEKAIHEQAAAASAPTREEPTPAPQQDTAGFDTSDPQLVNVATRTALNEIAASELGEQMRLRGIPIPKDLKEFNELVDTQPYFATQFKSEFQRLYTATMSEAREVKRAMDTVGSHNESTLKVDADAFKSVAKDLGIEITDQEISELTSKIATQPHLYETKYGVRFLRPGAVKEAFIATVLPGKISAIREAAIATGRAQATSDMERVQKRTPSTISNAGSVPRDNRSVQKVPDFTDQSVIEGLPDEALDDPEGYFKRKGFVK